MDRITLPQDEEYFPYYGKYIALVSGEPLAALAAQHAVTHRMLAPLDDARAMHRYAPGKWSVKEVVGHVMDCERVFAYRALSIARGDSAPLPCMDEDRWAPEGRFDERPMPDLVAELAAVRAATLALVHGLPAGVETRRGTACDKTVSVRALVAIIAGHELHHVAMLRERYGLT